MRAIFMQTEKRIVTDTVFLLGLDYLYREAIKPHERGELLTSVRQVTAALGVAPAAGPVEGYYAEDARLTAYFQLMRGLQAVDGTRVSEVADLPAFQRLTAVTSSPIYGRAGMQTGLLPAGRDVLAAALIKTRPDWTVASLTAAAFDAALEMDDFSLVGLAARSQNSVVLAALRESVVLYAEMVCLSEEPQPIEYVWAVDAQLTRQGHRFVDTFNALFETKIPVPGPEQAGQYWEASSDNNIVGRCVRLGHLSWGERFENSSVLAYRYLDNRPVSPGPGTQLAVPGPVTCVKETSVHE